MSCQQGKYTEPQKNLLRSVIKGDKSRVEELLKQFQWNPEQLSKILLHAVRLGTLEAAHMLLEAGADLNTCNQDEYINFFTQFTSLVYHNNPACRNYALLMTEHVGDVKVRSQMAFIFLERAINNRSMTIDVIERLVNAIDVNCIGISLKAFRYLELFERPDAARVVPLLLQRNLYDDKMGSRRAAEALFLCIQYAEKEQALLYTKMILDMQFSACDLDIYSTLASAVQREHLEIVQLLLAYGFNVNKLGKDGLLPLYIAAGLQQSTITKLLIEAGAQVNAHSGRGFPIHNACQNASADNIQMLLHHGAAFDVIDSLGLTPLMLISGTFHGDLMTRAHQAVIKELAVLVSKNILVRHEDLMSIRVHKVMRLYYYQCMYELKTMKTCNIINDIPFLSIFREDIKELLFATRKCDFVENAVICEDKFPIFYKEMYLSIKNAKQHKEMLRDKEEALYDSLKNVLPDIPMQKIICYLYFL